MVNVHGKLTLQEMSDGFENEDLCMHGTNKNGDKRTLQVTDISAGRRMGCGLTQQKNTLLLRAVQP